jgi:hypothetical protein
MLDSVQHTIETSVEDGPATGTYRVARDIFTDPKIFEMEMQHKCQQQGSQSGSARRPVVELFRRLRKGAAHQRVSRPPRRASSRVAVRPKKLWRTIRTNSRCQGSRRGTGK